MKGREVRQALRELFGDRCAFCNIGRTEENELEAHHLRPPQDAVGADGATSRSHYWWLVYEWENLYLACAECRAAQGAKFPVSQTRARVGARDDALDREGPLLIDPCREDPEPSFVYLDSGEMAARDYRGRATI
ncbi:MAG TPA: hypothetical protein VNM87_06020, partial [Candidatus Udaeobacter sp.]|nr:hypothetical protein [Candidatus Udaeobacter sp.]